MKITCTEVPTHIEKTFHLELTEAEMRAINRAVFAVVSPSYNYPDKAIERERLRGIHAVLAHAVRWAPNPDLDPMFVRADKSRRVES